MPKIDRTAEMMGYYGEMIGAQKALATVAPAMLTELETWARENVKPDGTVGASDWPGWKSFGIVRPGR